MTPTNKIPKILIKDDKKCQKLTTYPWSATLHKSFLTHWYWTLQMSTKATEHNYSTMLQYVESVVGKDNLCQSPNKTNSIKQHQA